LLLFRRNLPLRRDCLLLLLFWLHFRRMSAAVRNVVPQRGIGMNQHAVGGLLTFPGYWKMCRGARAGVKALRPRSGALQRGLDSGPASATLCLSGECQFRA